MGTDFHQVKFDGVRRYWPNSSRQWNHTARLRSSLYLPTAKNVSVSMFVGRNMHVATRRMASHIFQARAANTRVRSVSVALFA
jgi:hypothetical protein